MIVIVGAGPAGIAAALREQERGAEITVIGDNPEPGGQIWRGMSEQPEVVRFGASGIRLISSARVISGDPARHSVVVETPGESFEMRYEKLILATGLRELFLPFPGWTLPGVFGAGGLQVMAKSGLPVKGKRVIVAGTGPLLVAVAASLRKLGADVSLVAEQAPPGSLAVFARGLLRNLPKLREGAQLLWAVAGVPWLTDCWVESAQGDGHLQRVTLRRGPRTWTADCDYIGVGYGLCENDELVDVMGAGPDVSIARSVDLQALRRAFPLRPELRTLPGPDTIVCRCEGVRYEQLHGFPSFRAAKLQTRCGMGACQGRVCGPALRFLFGWRDASVRPPVFPARIGSLIQIHKAKNE